MPKGRPFFTWLCLLSRLLFYPAYGLEMSVDPEILMPSTERIGVNLGTWTTWGAEQLSQNILMNPGFEGDLDRVIIITSQADKKSFSDEKDWGYDDDYWAGAEFEVRTGLSKGKKGKILHSYRKGPKNLPQYIAEKPLPPLEPKDVVVLSKAVAGKTPPIWWIAENQKERIIADTENKRPLSPGSQSLQLKMQASSPPVITYYLDAIGERAGKLLPVNGLWRLSLWLRSDHLDNHIHLLFRRINGSVPFFEQTIPVTADWQEYVFDFHSTDKGEPQTLEFKITAEGSEGNVWIDDVFLGSLQGKLITGFREEMVETLKALRPSYIRDTQGQLGDSFDNRVAGPFARLATSTRSYAGNRSLSMPYSIPELFLLCKAVGANPWIVIPTTFSEKEALRLGEFLAANASLEVFPSVIVEFGNENWNWVFRATGIPYAPQHGEVAEKIFQKIREGAGAHVNLRTIVNGQHVSPENALEFIKHVPSADTLAIAPYFFYSLTAGSDPTKNLGEMFAGDGGLMKRMVALLHPLDKTLAMYEVNLHTTKGDAPARERDAYTAGMAAGSALAKRLLEGLLLGVSPEMVFSFVQFDADTADIRDKVKLWGIVRDLGEANQWRPQGLAVIMLNAVIEGELHGVSSKEPSPITAAAFYRNQRWSLAAVNASHTPREVTVEFPEGFVPDALWTLHAKSPFDTNEGEKKVSIVSSSLKPQGRSVSFILSPWGFGVLADSSKKKPL